MRELDRDVPIYALQSLGQYRHDRLSDLSIGSALLGIIGSLAVALAEPRALRRDGVLGRPAHARDRHPRRPGRGAAPGRSLFVREGSPARVGRRRVGVVLAAGVVQALSAVFLGVASSDALTSS